MLFYSVFVVVIAVRSMAVAVVDVVHVIAVLDRLVSAVRTVGVVGVLVRLMLGARHTHDCMRKYACESSC